MKAILLICAGIAVVGILGLLEFVRVRSEYAALKSYLRGELTDLPTNVRVEIGKCGLVAVAQLRKLAAGLESLRGGN
jgi:hypothetical protein